MSCQINIFLNGTSGNLTEVLGLMNDTNRTVLCVKQVNNTYEGDGGSGDATWILTSAFIIFTMQSGFGLLEAGEMKNS